jgi:DNA processing protein
VTAAGDPARACLVALLGLPHIGPARLRRLLDHAGGPEAAWALVRSGRLAGVDLRAVQRRDEIVSDLIAAASRTDPHVELARHADAGVRVLLPDDPGWPRSLAVDPEPPAALFAVGDVALLDEVSVGLVGTRRCSAGGAHVAGELGAGLAAAGVHVVSGLALGVDGAAHRGALAAGGRPIAVVGSGIDHVYPQRHRQLWAEVARSGVLVSEAPLGRPPERWRFPARNRIIAALAAAVVVVESRERGGSITTAQEALDRGRTVLAVPGSPLAEQSAGTNQLLSDGAGVVRHAADVLDAIGVTAPGPARSEPLSPGGVLDGLAGVVAAVLTPAPCTIERIASVAEVSVADALTALALLEAAGVARRVPGGYEQVVG